MIAPLLVVALGCQGPPPAFERMPPVPSVHADVRLALVGDIGNPGRHNDRVAAAVGQMCRARGCDAILLLGDLLYPRGPERLDDPRLEAVMAPWLALDLPLALVLGNHDWGWAHQTDRWPRWQAWADQNPMVWLPAPNWSRDIGHTRLVAIDSDTVFWRGDRGEASFIKEQLSQTGPQWRVVLAHHPLRSNGPHGNAGSYEGRSWLPVASGRAVESLWRTSVCGQADVLAAGHDHLLQWIEHCGVQHLVSGAGSSVRPAVDRGNTPILAHEGLGFIWISLGEQLEVAVVDEAAIVVATGTAPRRSVSTADRLTP